MTVVRTPPASDPVAAALRPALAGAGPLVLAVSGGRDSMALLAAVHRAGLAAQVAAVATFDHGTGPDGRAAAALVERVATAAGLPVVVGRADAPLAPTEAAWRTARLAFLRDVAQRHAARLVTAHTRDDQRETVAFRILRRSGPRGLAGLDTDGGPLRPFLTLTRADVAAWAEAHGVTWAEDPSNAVRRHARNRLRLDLLPALESAHPGFGSWLDGLGQRSAAWRRRMDELAAELDRGGTAGVGSPEHVIAAHAVADYTPDELAVVWPALLARHGVTVDWRGTQRLSRFTTAHAVGSRLPLSGHTEVVRVRDGFVVRRTAPRDVADLSLERPLVPGVRFDGWRFHSAGSGAEPWRARLPAGPTLTLRAWTDGDRLRQVGAPPRRVARFLAEAGIAGPDRRGWPVVLADGEIVWIPGVRCGHVAGPGEPAVEWSGERIAG